MTRIISLITAFIMILGASSCSTGFNSQWNKATAGGKLHDYPILTGPWEGTWRSEVNGHSGQLRCIVTALGKDGKAQGGDIHQFQTPQACRFHYHATFMKVLSATYDVTHNVSVNRGTFTFVGDQKLSGMGGGIYHYEGRGTPAEFHATFRSASDHGVFEMKRP